ncbi:MAG TPA: signal peptidase II [Candidatus Limnocylindria bacterium]|nr:signal peptidase II [Candidatus Limnocylindria bacterium]
MSEVRSELLPRAADGAPTGRPLWPTFLGLAGLIVVLDQLAKAWLTSFLAKGQSVEVLGDYVRLVHSQNAGGLFGLLQGQALPFGLVSLVVVAFVVLYHAKAGRNRYLSITLGLLLGGALGNLMDRLRLGYVVDFVDAGIGDLRWYTFNVADAGISFALLLLIAASIWPSVTRRASDDA